MSKAGKGGKAIRTVADLLAHALAMETEAAERYGELADQMEMHRNAPVGELFRRLEKLERAHVGELEALCRGVELPHLAPWEYRWGGNESPEAIDVGRVHYLISARDAVLLALEHERGAAAFYSGVAADARPGELKRLAEQFAAEEVEHIAWLEQWLQQCPPAGSPQREDPDPPTSQE